MTNTALKTVIVFDEGTPGREFYLHVEPAPNTVEFVELGVSTLPLAVAKANALGYDPRLWKKVNPEGKAGPEMDIPKSVLK